MNKRTKTNHQSEAQAQALTVAETEAVAAERQQRK